MWGYAPRPIQIHEFGDQDPLAQYGEMLQGQYLRRYLADLGAVTVVQEFSYFDRDYLAEYSAFYATTAGQLSGLCSRLHFFSARMSRGSLRSLLTGSQTTRQRWQSAYLGFVVIRPIDWAPFGRTVLAWYPQDASQQRRIT